MAGPRNLIRKRQDKLLDFEMIEEKSSLSYDEQAIANTYKTINTLLLNELPQFNGKALQLLWATLGAFSCLQKDLAMDIDQLATSFTHQVGRGRVTGSNNGLCKEFRHSFTHTILLSLSQQNRWSLFCALFHLVGA